MHIREIITSTASSRPKTLFHFYDANHLYLMTIALTRKNKNDNITPKYKSSIAKKTYLIKSREISSEFRRQMALNMQIIQQHRKQATRKKQCKIHQHYRENATRQYSERKPKNNQVKAIIIPIST